MRCIQFVMYSLCFVLGLSVAHQALAKGNYGMAGCGLGSIVMGPSGGQISAATTNATSYTQVFGITSGTSNCTPSQDLAVIMKQEQFLAVNLNTLQKEMAQGGGDTVFAFADILGCPAGLRQEAADTLAKEYATIFKAPGIGGVLDSAKEELRKRAKFKTSCTIVG